MARPTPVLPLVASTMRPPGLSRPSRSAASIIATPMRSLTEPPGLKNSALAQIGVLRPTDTRFSRMSGVQPIVSRTLAYALAWGGRSAAATGVGHRLGRWRRRVPALGRIPARRGVAARRRVPAHGGTRDGLRLGNGDGGRHGGGGPRLGRLRMPELDRLGEQRGNGDAVPLRGRVGPPRRPPPPRPVPPP